MRRGESAALKAARAGMPLRENDALRTFAESGATVKTSNGLTVHVRENTVLYISDLLKESQGVQTTKVKIFFGGVFAEVDKNNQTEQSEYIFEAPTSIASIRGTKLSMDVTEERAEIRVYEGEVAVTAVGNPIEVLVSAHEMTTVSRNAAAIKKVALVPLEKDLLTMKTTVAPDSKTPAPTRSGQPKTRTGRSTNRRRQDCTVTVVNPTSRQEVVKREVTVMGFVPKGAKVHAVVSGVKGKQELTVAESGQFTGEVTIAKFKGRQAIKVVAELDGGTCSETRAVIHLPDDPDVPTMTGPIVKNGTICFKVEDATEGDRTTLHFLIDGERDEKTGVPGEMFCIDMLTGHHDYVAFATDKDQQRSRKWTQRLPYLPKNMLTLTMGRPARDETVALSRPDDDDDTEYLYPVSFSIDNLPDDDPGLLKTIVVQNKTTYDRETETPPSSVDFDYELKVKKGRNLLVIQVTDINDITQTRQFQITVR